MAEFVRYPEEPRSWILRNALVGPRLESTQHGFLHALFSQVQTGGSQNARKMCNDAADLMPKQVLQKDAGVSARDVVHGGAGSACGAHENNWRSSMVPCSRCG